MGGIDNILEIHSRREIQATSLWLHGQGADSEDLTPLFRHLEQARELGLRYLAPNAPMRRLQALEGRLGRAWYDVAAADGPDPDPESLSESVSLITGLLENELEAGRSAELTVVGGFSQGGALALEAALQFPQALAGIVVLSGELLQPDTLAQRIHPANAATPILMIHGEEDPLIPVHEAESNRDQLLSLGLPVEWHRLPLGHEISMETISLVDDWLLARLKALGVTAEPQAQ
ncbi:phospholipase [Halovibrio salipaludis]|uniref:Phospholipase n=1 Tax=Halovibrio salipaludis TaxID=2032626 RepID=A0A2A2FA50_9GAMM|nr:dienelactone hydrolase family protein [Halovibrio salipaludis]PAU81614.1 phospholipase [Halovibrio salipaludis]